MPQDDSLKHKLSEAVTPTPPPTSADSPKGQGRPNDADEPQDAALKQANAQTNSGIKDNDQRLVDVGRGRQTAGRQGQ
jgi:hypothetical protein